jgi:hypothetical protein
LAAIDALKEDSVIVFIDGSNLHLTPQAVQDAIVSDAAFGPLPIVAVFDAGIQKQLGAVGYRSMKDVNGFKEVTAALAKLRGKEAAPSKLVQARPEMWQDRRGRTIRATYVGSTAEDVTLLLDNGKHATLKLSALSEVSQKRVAELGKK